MALRRRRGGPSSLLPVLPELASPWPLPEAFGPKRVDSVGEHRALGCRNYDACLSYAVAAAWQNFTCRRCFLSVPEPAEEKRSGTVVLATVAARGYSLVSTAPSEPEPEEDARCLFPRRS